jgi:hypothetical protein
MNGIRSKTRWVKTTLKSAQIQKIKTTTLDKNDPKDRHQNHSITPG